MKAEYLAIITARSGSKRLLNKNILPLRGKPLFVWSVDAAKAATSISKVVVSTDSTEYQSIALKAGAFCEQLRSPLLATDTTSSVDVVLEVLNQLGNEIHHYKGLVLLQPTSPLRTAQDIDNAVTLFSSHQVPAVVSVCETECPPAWIGQLPSNLCMDSFIPKQYKGKRSQDLGIWYRLNGAIYVIGIQTFLKERDFKPQGTIAYVMPRERSVDVDTQFDFQVASALLETHSYPD